MRDPMAQGVDRGTHARAGLQLMITSIVIMLLIFALIAFLLAQDLPGKKYVEYTLLILLALAGFVFFRGRVLYGNLGFFETQPRVQGTVLRRRMIGDQSSIRHPAEVTYWLEIQPAKGKPTWVKVDKTEFARWHPKSTYAPTTRW